MSDEEEDMDAVLVRLESPNSPIRRIDSRNRLYQDKVKKLKFYLV